MILEFLEILICYILPILIFAFLILRLADSFFRPKVKGLSKSEYKEQTNEIYQHISGESEAFQLRDYKYKREEVLDENGKVIDIKHIFTPEYRGSIFRPPAIPTNANKKIICDTGADTERPEFTFNIEFETLEDDPIPNPFEDFEFATVGPDVPEQPASPLSVDQHSYLKDDKDSRTLETYTREYIAEGPIINSDMTQEHREFLHKINEGTLGISPEATVFDSFPITEETTQDQINDYILSNLLDKEEE